MKTAIDTNILISLWLGEPPAQSFSMRLHQCRAEGSLVVSPFVFAELLACPQLTETLLRSLLQESDIGIDFLLPPTLWTEAGSRFRSFAQRRRGSSPAPPRRILADFLIGAHAMLYADRLFTRDRSHFEQNFPELTLVDLPT